MAFSLITKALEAFTNEYSEVQIQKTTTRLECKAFTELIKTYQDPYQADPMLRVQKDLDETKVILVIHVFLA